MAITLDTLGEQLERFYKEWQEELFQLYAGIKTESSLGKIYVSWQSLFSFNTILELRTIKSSLTAIEDKRRAEHLEKILTGGYLEQSGREWLDKFITARINSVVEFEGKAIPYTTAMNEFSKERSRERRQLLFNAMEKTTIQLDEFRKKQLEEISNSARQLGYISLVALFRSLSGIDVTQLLEICEAAGRDLDELFDKSMERTSMLLSGVSFSNLAEWDLQYLLKGTLFDGYFPVEFFINSFWAVAQGLGIMMADRKNMVMDLEPRSGKGGTSAVFPIRIPQQLVFVVVPGSGYLQYKKFYQEIGRALFYAHIKETLPFEFRAIGDGALEEAYALLFESLISNPKWWSLVMQCEMPPYIREYTASIKLFEFRDALGSVLADEYLLSSWYNQDPRPECAAIREKWRKIKYMQNSIYLKCQLLRPVWRLRGFLFEAYLRTFLVKQYGQEWFASHEAGALLRKFWAQGTRYKAEELLEKLGFTSLDPQFLVRELKDDLRRFN